MAPLGPGLGASYVVENGELFVIQCESPILFRPAFLSMLLMSTLSVACGVVYIPCRSLNNGLITRPSRVVVSSVALGPGGGPLSTLSAGVGCTWLALVVAAASRRAAPLRRPRARSARSWPSSPGWADLQAVSAGPCFADLEFDAEPRDGIEGGRGGGVFACCPGICGGEGQVSTHGGCDCVRLRFQGSDEGGGYIGGRLGE
jgi:hypothetical protein